jgi:hypothetical protein
MITVNSSVIDRIGYDEDGAILMVIFKSGKGYAYIGVEPHVYQNFVNADSKGQFFNEFIRNEYIFMEIE